MRYGKAQLISAKLSALHSWLHTPSLGHVSDEKTNSTEGSHGAPAGFANTAIFKKKTVKKDPMVNLLMMIGILGIVACVLSVAMGFMFAQ